MAKSKVQVTKISTGIDGLDNLIYGGIPEKGQILLIGDVGSGKTLFAFEIAYRNAKRGIPTTFLTIDEDRDSLIESATEAFGEFDLDELLEGGKLNIEEKKLQYAIKSPEGIQAIVAEIIGITEQNNSKMLVVDSFSLLRSLYSDDRSFTRGMNYTVESLRNQGITSIITVETTHNSDRVPGLFDESMFDGIIKLSKESNELDPEHLITVINMRFSKFKSTINSFSITPSGITISRKQKTIGANEE